MKKTITTLALLITIFTYAQNVGINSTGASPDASAMLDVDAAPSNDKGLLLPRVALLAANNPLPVASPAVSLMVYNTAIAGSPPNDVVPGFYYWDGTRWVSMMYGGIPSGAVWYFNLAACPSGWTDLVAAEGRYIVGLTSSGTLAAVNGTPLTDLEDRPVGQHNHTITDPGHNHFSGDFSYVFTGPFDWNFGGASPNVRNVSGIPVSNNTTGITINNSGTVAGTNAPYIQLKVCQKN